MVQKIGVDYSTEPKTGDYAETRATRKPNE